MGESGSTYVITDLLENTARMFSKLSSVVDATVADNPPQPPRLGSAPPAVAFTRLMTELTGPDGAIQIMRGWASGLATMSREQHEAVADYVNSEEYRESVIQHVDRTEIDDIFSGFDNMVSDYRRTYLA